MARKAPRGTAVSARVRAARAYADLDRSDFGAAIGISERQVTRLEAGQAAPDGDLRRMIATACGVPESFMEVGFAPLEHPMTDAERRVHELQGQFTELRAAVVALAAGNLMQTRERLGLDETGHPAEPAAGAE